MKQEPQADSVCFVWPHWQRWTQVQGACPWGGASGGLWTRSSVALSFLSGMWVGCSVRLIPLLQIITWCPCCLETPKSVERHPWKVAILVYAVLMRSVHMGLGVWIWILFVFSLADDPLLWWCWESKRRQAKHATLRPAGHQWLRNPFRSMGRPREATASLGPDIQPSPSEVWQLRNRKLQYLHDSLGERRETEIADSKIIQLKQQGEWSWATTRTDGLPQVWLLCCLDGINHSLLGSDLCRCWRWWPEPAARTVTGVCLMAWGAVILWFSFSLVSQWCRYQAPLAPT